MTHRPRSPASLVFGALGPRRACAGNRPGVTLVIVVVLLAVSTTMFGIWARSAIRQQRQLRQREYAVQARRLAEAGVRRAAARLQGDADYSGETWEVTADMLGGQYDATVTVHAETSPEGSASIRATADYPASQVLRARHTSTDVVPLGRPSGDDPPADDNDSGEAS